MVIADAITIYRHYSVKTTIYWEISVNRYNQVAKFLKIERNFVGKVLTNMVLCVI